MDILNYIELAGNLFEAAYIVDRERLVLYWNRSAEEFTGYRRAEMIGQACGSSLLLPPDEQGKRLCEEHCPFAAAQPSRAESQAYSLLHKDGYRIPVDLRCIPLRDGNKELVGVLKVFSRKKGGEQAERESLVQGLIQTAYIDPITKTPNKQYMEQKIKMLLAESEQTAAELLLGLLIVDIRNLGEFNSRGGIELGNLLLKIIAQTLVANVEPEGGSLVARWYGGSFIVFLQTNRTATLLNWATKLKAAIEKSQVPAWETMQVDVSIYGTIVSSGERFPDIIKHLEQQFQQSKLHPKRISVE